VQPRVLLAVLVYGGGSFVHRCVESAARVESSDCDVDAIILDDCSRDQAWSAELASRCAALSVQYYRSPRNLGIPRNMNLAMRYAMAAEYDYVALLNSDTVLPRNLASAMVAVARSADDVGSVTSWSNNASMFSLPNTDANRFLANPDAVDWVSATLADEFGEGAVEIPSAVGFCVLLPVRVVREVGLMDPAFGRGYCEEIDWSQRSKALGYRNTMAPAAFVYHMGNASTIEAGIALDVEGSVPTNERLIDHRYPDFRSKVVEYAFSGMPERLVAAGSLRLVAQAARERGYVVEASWFAPGDNAGEVNFAIDPEGTSRELTGAHLGFTATITAGPSILGTLEDLTGRLPSRVVVQDHGVQTSELLQEARARSIDLVDIRTYPQRV
jgi:GT2 family glycosyltransferase